MKLTLLIILTALCCAAQIPVAIVSDSTTAPAQVATPTYNNDGNSYIATVSVTISDATGGASIFYCTNTGSDCSPVGGTAYTVPVVITTDLTHLCSYATHSGLLDSATYCAPYHIFPSITNLQLLMESDCITISPCAFPANGTGVTTWADKSANANTATKAAGGSCTLNTGQINGFPAVTFSTCHFNLTSTIAFGTGMTEFLVIKLATTSGGMELITGSTSSFAYTLNDTATHEQCAARDNQAPLGCGTFTTDTNWHQMNVVYDNSTNPAFRLARATDTTVSGAHGSVGGTTSGIGWNKPGNSGSFNGQVAFIAIFDRDLTPTEIGQVETYLNNKYGL